MVVHGLPLLILDQELPLYQQSYATMVWMITWAQDLVMIVSRTTGCRY